MSYVWHTGHVKRLLKKTIYNLKALIVPVTSFIKKNCIKVTNLLAITTYTNTIVIQNP